MDDVAIRHRATSSVSISADVDLDVALITSCNYSRRVDRGRYWVALHGARSHRDHHSIKRDSTHEMIMLSTSRCIACITLMTQ